MAQGSMSTKKKDNKLSTKVKILCEWWEWTLFSGKKEAYLKSFESSLKNIWQSLSKLLGKFFFSTFPNHFYTKLAPLPVFFRKLHSHQRNFGLFLIHLPLLVISPSARRVRLRKDGLARDESKDLQEFWHGDHSDQADRMHSWGHRIWHSSW